MTKLDYSRNPEPDPARALPEIDTAYIRDVTSKPDLKQVGKDQAAKRANREKQARDRTLRNFSPLSPSGRELEYQDMPLGLKRQIAPVAKPKRKKNKKTKCSSAIPKPTPNAGRKSSAGTAPIATKKALLEVENIIRLEWGKGTKAADIAILFSGGTKELVIELAKKLKLPPRGV